MRIWSAPCYLRKGFNPENGFNRSFFGPALFGEDPGGGWQGLAERTEPELQEILGGGLPNPLSLNHFDLSGNSRVLSERWLCGEGSDHPPRPSRPGGGCPESPGTQKYLVVPEKMKFLVYVLSGFSKKKKGCTKTRF